MREFCCSWEHADYNKYEDTPYADRKRTRVADCVYTARHEFSQGNDDLAMTWLRRALESNLCSDCEKDIRRLLKNEHSIVPF